MTKISFRILPAALVLAFASAALPALAQSAEPTTTEKVENTGKKAWSATKKTSKKAWKATKKGSKKAWRATKKGASKAADATRQTGEKIGEKIPTTPQYDAAHPKP